MAFKASGEDEIAFASGNACENFCHGFIRGGAIFNGFIAFPTPGPISKQGVARNIGFHRAWGHNMHLNPEMGGFAADGIEIAEQAVFGRAIAAPHRCADDPGHAGNRHQPSAALGHHMGQDGLCEGNRGEQIDRDDPFIDGEISFHCQRSLRDARIVDEAINPPCPVDCLFDDCGNRREIGCFKGEDETVLCATVCS